jgi:hypothetical protein
MNWIKNSKKFSFLALVIFTITLALLFFGLWNTSLLTQEGQKLAIVNYIYLFIIFLSGSFLSFLAMKNNTLASSLSNHLTEIEEREKKEKKAREQAGKTKEERQQEAIDERVQKVVPPDETGNIEEYSENLLKKISKEYEIVVGLVHVRKPGEEIFSVAGKYAFYADEPPADFKLGETIPGQAAKDKQLINISGIPETYFEVMSGLGKSIPTQMLVVPVVHEDETIAVLELAAFKAFNQKDEMFFNSFASKVSGTFAKLTQKV